MYNIIKTNLRNFYYEGEGMSITGTFIDVVLHLDKYLIERKLKNEYGAF